MLARPVKETYCPAARLKFQGATCDMGTPYLVHLLRVLGVPEPKAFYISASVEAHEIQLDVDLIFLGLPQNNEVCCSLFNGWWGLSLIPFSWAVKRVSFCVCVFFFNQLRSAASQYR